AKVGRINDHCVLSFYAEGRYLDNINMPILIATSSSSQQKALVNDFIPELSRILMDAEIIKQPITVVLRKGREHYVCENRLRNYVLNENKQNVKNALDSLLKPSTRIDLTKVDGLSKYAKQRVSAPDRCGLRCKYKDTCSYQFFRKEVKSYEIDIQVCDHNYLIADAIHRNELQPPLLPNYQMCIITEAHNFHKAARLMYGVELSSVSLPYLKKCIDRLGIKHELAEKQINKLSKKLATVSRNLFRHLINQTNDNDDCDVRDDNQIAATIDCNIARYLCSIHELSYKISDLLTFVPVAGNADDLKINVLFELKQILKQVTEFMNQNEVTCNIEKDHNEVRMCGTPKNLAARLYKEMWCKGIPTILLSGTLSVNGDFTKTKKSLGLDKVGSYRMTEKAGIQS
ncbi:MAG: hypothetical protein FWD38_12235, partial [Oscillospiraceae bacterium]|nr:hypothetical protein [Oscillospiraceae bacterium]